MKNLKLLILICFLSNSIFLFAQKKTNDNIKIVRLQTSAHTVQCKAKIEKTLAFEKGVIESELDKKTQILTVKFKKNKTDVSKIINVITELGHSAEEIPESNVKENMKQ